VGSYLHQSVMRVRTTGRRIWAINRCYLDSRRANLRSLTYADVKILTSSRPSTQAVGVARPAQPKFFKTQLRPFQARIRVRGKTLCLGWFATLEEAQAAYDSAALMVHGRTTTTNRSLGLLSPVVVGTKPCRRAAKAARRVVKAYRSGERVKALRAATTAR